MSAWRGLTRPEQHRVTSIPDMAYCVVCGDCCWRVEPCRCCLAAEERLTAALAERDRRVEASTLLGNPIVCDRWMPEMTCRMEIGACRCIEHVGSFMAYPDQACERARINSALHVLDTSQTDIAAELEHAVRGALRGES